MKILLASPERDLLECYKTLLQSDVGEVVTAFDGAQVLSLINAEKFDIAVLDTELPRVQYGVLLEKIKEKNVASVAMINEAESVRKLKNEPRADAYLQYPFGYGRIKSVITETLDKARKGLGKNE